MSLKLFKTKSMLSMIGTWSASTPIVTGLANTLKLTLPNGVPMEVTTLREDQAVKFTVFSFAKKDLTGDHILSLRKIPENSAAGLYETEDRVFMGAEITSMELSQVVLEMLIRGPSSVHGTTLGLSDGQVVDVADWKRVNGANGEINFRMDLVRAVDVQGPVLSVLCEGGIKLSVELASISAALAESKKIRAALPLMVR